MNRESRILRGGVLLLIFAGLVAGCFTQKVKIRFGGGPRGATFPIVAEGIAEILNHDLPNIEVIVESSGGSSANLKGVDEGYLEMALVHAGDAYDGWQGIPPTRNVRALARVFGSTAQLVVPWSSVVNTPNDLRGRRVAIGSPGSGAAHSAERFFRALGIWEEIVPIYLGYGMATEELLSRRVDALWEVVGVPSDSLQKLSLKMHIRFLNLKDAANASGLFETYPYYTGVVIAKGSYYRQTEDIETFQDATLWVANSKVDKDFIYVALTLLFNEQGLERIRKTHPVTQDFSLDNGLHGVTIPLHPGAEKFWESQGMAKPHQR